MTVSRRQALIGLGGALAAMAVAKAQERATMSQDQQPRGQIFELEDLLADLEKAGRPYHEFLRVKSLRSGLYRLPKGAVDRQSPHDEDEVYSVIRGKARFRLEDTVRPVGPGAVVYVRAGVEHRFEEIEEELLLLVVFASAPPR